MDFESGIKIESAAPAQAVDILGIQVHCVDFDQTLQIIQEWLGATIPLSPIDNITSTYQICTVNPEYIIDARRNPTFARVLKEASLAVPDGVGILWAAHVLGRPLCERVTGSDGIYRICERAAINGWRVFLLGAAPGIARCAAERLKNLYPGLGIAGTYSGDPHAQAWPEIKERLQRSHPDILFVAFGHPQQDLWIARHRGELPVRLAIGVGGAFDFVAGAVPRAPRWMRRLGLEWLFRLIQQPSRLGRMMKLPIFVVMVLRKALVRVLHAIP